MMRSTGSFLCFLLPALLAVSAAATTRYVDLNSPSPALPYTNWPTAATNIQDAIDASDAGDQILVTNGVYQAGGRVVYGSLTNRVAVTRPLTLQSVNGPAVTIISGNPIRGTNAVRCVYLTNNAILAGFTLMNGATLNSGDPLKELSGGGAWCESSSAVLSNCVFTTNVAVYSGAGVCQGTILNSSFISNSVVLQGGAAWQCTLSNCALVRNLANHGGGAYGGALYACTLTTNRALQGGGAYQSALYDCALTNNRAEGGAGGGSYQGNLSRCVLTGNWAYNAGGGTESATLWACKVISNSTAYSQAGGVSGGTCFNCLLRGNLGGADNSTLYNCTVVQNTAGVGGGIFGGKLFNSIVYYNSAPTGTNWFQSPVMTNCCTTPLPPGSGNITNAPLFLDLAAGNLRLQLGSPCIDAGNSGYATNSADLDGRPRILGAAVDMGAYEFQGPGLGEFIGWLEQHGLVTDGSADYGDPDGDAMNDWQEWIAGTDPTNSASLLKMLTPTRTNTPDGLVLTWQSVSGRTYFLQRGTNVASQGNFATIASNIFAFTNSTAYNDTAATNRGPYFYRVGVQ